MSKRKIPGLTVWQRGKSWAYRVDGEPDPVTGQPKRHYKGRFPTEAEALQAAIEAKQRLEVGRAPNARRVRVGDFLHEWIEVNETNFKATTAQGFRDSINFYVVPNIGQRWLGDLTVPVFNAFYKRLLDSGRTRKDRNAEMYEYWKPRQHLRDGLGPRPGDIAEACGATYDAARTAAMRFRRGRTPQPAPSGLSTKTVRNVHTVMRLALTDAVHWGYLHTNPAAHAVVPRPKRQGRQKKRAQVWTVDELARWLSHALEDRYSGMWCLAATSGMRRSELAGVERSMLDLEKGVLYIEDTRVVVAGRAQSSDGKSEAGSREISLDPFTTEQLRLYVERIDRERDALRDQYPDHDYLMVGPEGRPLHPDTITARFNRLVDRAGVPKIRLHDVRHTYATLALDNGQNIKLLSQRIGHADTSVTLRIYTHRTTGVDRDMADHMGSLISSAVDSLKGRSVPLSVPGHRNPASDSTDGGDDEPPPTGLLVPA